ncbi:MAG: gliding motility-associated C-terminal domain-containing protein, partial [Bacteroidales bacterium]|nr:gliding motility-associated C-terminal domain-containing protein [Bacteroidales bacterium]
EREKGVSLERIDPNIPGIERRNWHSASYEVGYSTPGEKNSQVLESGKVGKMFSLSTNKITPNNDGYEDYLVINYEFQQPGWTAGIWIFDINGEMVVHLLDNELLSVSGNITWNATDETGSTVQTGYYVVYIEAMNDRGEKETLKKSCLVLP